MDLLVLAQLITGIATLVVATVLIWQMIIQKKALDIAHNDNDANMSLQAMESHSEQTRWIADQVSDEMLERMEKGYEFLTRKEKFLVKKNAMNTYQVLATEWRLKRVDRNIGHYKQAFKNHMMFLDYKASRDWFKIWTENWKNQKPYPSKLDSSVGDINPLVDPNFQILAREVYEETSGEKLN